MARRPGGFGNPETLCEIAFSPSTAKRADVRQERRLVGDRGVGETQAADGAGDYITSTGRAIAWFGLLSEVNRELAVDALSDSYPGPTPSLHPNLE